MATIATTPISPLRQRMEHDMMMRGLSPRTQHQYVRSPRPFNPARRNLRFSAEVL